MIIKMLNNLFNTEETKNKLDFLDGYRGSLAIWVLIGHTNMIFKILDQYPFDMSGHYIGVNGFFILSSFLLTYRLFDELVSSKQTYKKILLTMLKYTIRRFFRIYVPFVITISLIKYDQKFFGGCFSYSSSWYDLITLKYPHGNHLWTIGPEIKYYALIPLICLFFYNIENDKLYLKIIKLIIASLSVYFFIKFYFKKDLFSKLYCVFLNGSILAILYHKLKNFQVFKYLQTNSLLTILGFVTMCLYAKGVTLSSLPYNSELSNIDKTNLDNNVGVYTLTYKVSIYWTIVLFLMLVGTPNFFTNIFEMNVLRTAGKYSFGIYLLHPMCINLVRDHIKPVLKYEYFFYVLLLSFFVGFLFFHLVENIMIKLANFLCRKISELRFFQIKEINDLDL